MYFRIRSYQVSALRSPVKPAILAGRRVPADFGAARVAVLGLAPPFSIWSNGPGSASGRLFDSKFGSRTSGESFSDCNTLSFHFRTSASVTMFLFMRLTDLGWDSHCVRDNKTSDAFGERLILMHSPIR